MMTATLQLQNVSFEQVKMAVKVLKAMGIKANVDNERKPNKTTLKAIQEAEKLLKDENSIGYDNIDDLFNALND